MTGKVKTSPEVKARIIADYERGCSSVQLAAAYSLSPSTIINYLDEAGVDRRPAGQPQEVTPELAELASKMRKQGINWKTISKKIGLSREALARGIKRLATHVKDLNTTGEGPFLYTVVVEGPKHSKPTLWSVRAWDAAAAEAIGVKQAGYDPDEDEGDYWADSMFVCEIIRGLS